MTARSILSASLPALGRVYRRFKDNFPAFPLGRSFRFGGQTISTMLQSHSVQQRANRAAAADLDWMDGVVGRNGGWARTEYGDYYAKAVSVYAAYLKKRSSKDGIYFGGLTLMKRNLMKISWL